MDTKILPFANPTAQEQALALLAAEQVIAAPTDTVYGLMCRYDSAAAIERIYIAKDRPPQKAIPVLLSDVDQLGHVAQLPLSPIAHRLGAQFWPGPLTLIVSARADLPAILTAHQDTVAVRIPHHDGLRQLIEKAGPLAATSANRSGEPPAHAVAAVMAQLAGRIPLILDAGESALGVASTIVDVSGFPDQPPRIVRSGPIDAQVQEMLDETR